MGSFTEAKEAEFGPQLKLGKVNRIQLWLGHLFRELWQYINWFRAQYCRVLCVEVYEASGRWKHL